MLTKSTMLAAQLNQTKEQLAAMTAERDRWMNNCQMGGNPLHAPPDFMEPAICDCDPKDKHEIYGTGYKQDDGSIWCELHFFRNAIKTLTAERDALNRALNNLQSERKVS